MAENMTEIIFRGEIDDAFPLAMGGGRGGGYPTTISKWNIFHNELFDLIFFQILLSGIEFFWLGTGGGIIFR
jgi:hypothetical protein